MYFLNKVETGLIFKHIAEVTERINSFLKLINLMDDILQNEIKIAFIQDMKKQFIEDIIFLKKNQIIIKHKTGMSYIEYLANNIENNIDILNHQLNTLNRCIEKQIPDLFFKNGDEIITYQVIH